MKRRSAKGDLGRRDFQKLGRPAPGPVQGFAKGAVAGRLLPRDGREGGAFLGVEIKPVPDRVLQAHFAHI